MMKPTFLPALAALASTALAAPALYAASAISFGSLPMRFGYAELADLALAAPITLAVTIQKAQLLKGDSAAGVPPGKMRYFAESQVDSLIAGRAELPATVRFLVDLPASERPLKLKGASVILLAAVGPRPGEVRLIGPRAMVPRTPDNEQTLRGILQAAIAPDATPPITGIGHAFHVAGSLPGEGETQIFLKTADNRPISLSILRRPGEQPRWAVALSELTDASAEPPKPNSFLWYRLACGLPRGLPAESTAGLAQGDADQAIADYRLVLDGLGPCNRKGESS